MRTRKTQPSKSVFEVCQPSFVAIVVKKCCVTAKPNFVKHADGPSGLSHLTNHVLYNGGFV